MTDRAKTITVVLEHDTRVDDVEPLLAAIRALRGVADARVTPGDRAVIEDIYARSRVRMELAEALRETIQRVLYPEKTR